jgi:hypothetical protein
MMIGILSVACIAADRGFAADHKHVDRQIRELSGESGKTIEAPFGAALFDLEMVALDKADVAQSQHKLAA